MAKLKKVTPAKKPLKKVAAVPAKKPLKRVTVTETAKKPLKKIERPAPPAKITQGPVPVVPKKFKWKGKPDKHNKKRGFILVAPDKMPDTFPRPHPRMLPDTFWRVDPKHNEVKCLVTILQSDVHVAWDSCAVCLNRPHRCICRQGFLHPRGLEWMHIRGALDKEGVHRYHERLAMDHHAVQERAFHWYVGKSLSRLGETVKHDTDWYRRRKAEQQTRALPVRQGAAKPSERLGRLPRAGNKPVSKPAPARKPLKKVRQEDLAPVQSLSKINQSAEAMAEEMTANMKKQLKKSKR